MSHIDVHSDVALFSCQSKANNSYNISSSCRLSLDELVLVFACDVISSVKLARHFAVLFDGLRNGGTGELLFDLLSVLHVSLCEDKKIKVFARKLEPRPIFFSQVFRSGRRQISCFYCVVFYEFSVLGAAILKPNLNTSLHLANSIGLSFIWRNCDGKTNQEPHECRCQDSVSP